jgi:UDP:flavonoid glycosyltransferase YjiC (YdhE family)
VETFSHFSSVGFIVSLKDNDEVRANSIVTQLIKERGLTNVEVRKFLPQRTLLHSSKIDLFITHCGANSIFEAIYFGKPMIGLPQGIDQIGLSYKINRMKIGIGFASSKKPENVPSKQEFVGAIEKVLSDSSHSQKARRLMRL